MNELYHHGVKGMRWGVRKSVMQTGEKAATETKKAIDSTATTKSKIRSQKQAHKMTDAELRDAVNRMNLEEQYIRLSSSKVSKGRARVGTILDVASGVLAVGASAAVIAESIYKLKSAQSKLTP